MTVLYCRWIMYVQPVTRVLTKKTLPFSDARSKVRMAAYALTYEKVRHGWWKNPFKKTPWTFHPYYFHISFEHCSIFLLPKPTTPFSIISPFSLYDLLPRFRTKFFLYSIVFSDRQIDRSAFNDKILMESFNRIINSKHRMLIEHGYFLLIHN